MPVRLQPVRLHRFTADEDRCEFRNYVDIKIWGGDVAILSSFSENVMVALAASFAGTLATKFLAWLTAIQLQPDTLILCALMTLLAATILLFTRHTAQTTKRRLDLLFRMDYQAPFVQGIREDEEERALYTASVLRKLRDLAELKESDRDDNLCSYYIGCLAFLANEKRANLPWNLFRDELAKYFANEIIKGKISPHVINDHYKGMWGDLVAAAERARYRRRKPTTVRGLRKIVRLLFG